jgi:hypothetical protein
MAARFRWRAQPSDVSSPDGIEDVLTHVHQVVLHVLRQIPVLIAARSSWFGLRTRRCARSGRRHAHTELGRGETVTRPRQLDDVRAHLGECQTELSRRVRAGDGHDLFPGVRFSLTTNEQTGWNAATAHGWSSSGIPAYGRPHGRPLTPATGHLASARTAANGSQLEWVT